MSKEMVNHPDHYNREKSIECIEEMITVFGKEAVMNFCLCNVWKYRYRAAEKNGIEDLKKSDWYMNKYMELKEKIDIEKLPPNINHSYDGYVSAIPVKSPLWDTTITCDGSAPTATYSSESK